MRHAQAWLSCVDEPRPPNPSRGQTSQNCPINSQFLGQSDPSFTLITQFRLLTYRAHKKCVLSPSHKPCVCALREFIWKSVELCSSKWPPTFHCTCRILLWSFPDHLASDLDVCSISNIDNDHGDQNYYCPTTLSVRLLDAQIQCEWPICCNFISPVYEILKS